MSHLLSRVEIDIWQDRMLDGWPDEEDQTQIKLLCDMARAHLKSRIGSVKAARAMSQALNEGDGSYKP